MTPTSSFHNTNSIGAELALKTSSHPRRSLIDLRLSTPESKLTTLGGNELVRHQRHPTDPPTWTGGGRPVEPAIELPSHPVSHRRIRQRALVAPKPHELLAEFGFSFNRHSHAGHTGTPKTLMELIGKAAGNKGDPIDLERWWIDFGARRPVNGWVPRIRGPFVES